MNRYYPVMLNIENRLCTVIGGGHVAERKIHGLLNAGAHVRVVAPEIRGEISVLENTDIRKKAYEPRDIENSFIVIAATNNSSLNGKIISDAHKLGILAMSAEGGGDFINGAVRREGALTVQVSSGVPALSAHICRSLKLKAYSAAAAVLAKYRRHIKHGDYEELLSEQYLSIAESSAAEYENSVQKKILNDSAKNK